MTFRARLVVTLSAVTALITFMAFGAASLIVMRSEERQLDSAVREEAREEAQEIWDDGSGKKLQISDRGGPKADDVGRLVKYAAIYASDGAVIDKTETFNRPRGVPKRERLPETLDTPFDLRYGREKLRAILVEIPGTESVLLLGASREDLEEDASFLWKVMLMTALLSIGAVVSSSWWVVRHLTRGHLKITEAARKIAAGDLHARVALGSGDAEIVQLAKDIDEMVARLNLVIDGQSRFIAYAAHELRSPLTVLYGELQLALRRSRSLDEYRATISESLDAVKRLNRLVEDLLFLARIGAEKRELPVPTSLGDIVSNATYWVDTAAEEKSITIDIDVDEAAIVTSAMAIERILRNLLDNAVRHSPRGGKVSLRARVDHENIELMVNDEGPGILPSDRARIFEPFFRADEERQRDTGSGLGLALVREIARAHGGEALAEEGEGGKGARFRVRLRAGSFEKERAAG